MTEDLLLLPHAAAAEARLRVPAGPAWQLGREVAALGARLARLLGGLSLPGGVLEGSRTFLDTMFDTLAEGAPLSAFEGSAVERRPPGPPRPLDRLVLGLGLAPQEVELLLLAGMPDQHEGFASVLRVLSPRGEARATVGLAAQLLCGDDAAARQRLCEQLHTGAARRHGVLALAGEGGFFEQALVPAPALWAALGGVDAWPAELRTLAPPAAQDGLEDWLAGPAVRRALQALGRREPCLVVLGAESEEIALDRAAALCERAGVARVALDMPAAASVLALARLHALVRGAVPLLRVGSGDGEGDGAAAADPASPQGTAFPGAVVACVRHGTALGLGPVPVLHVEAGPLGAGARRRLWRRVLPELRTQAAVLALRHPVEPAVAERIACDVRAMALLDGAPPDLDAVAESVRVRSQARLAPGLRVVRPQARWEQLVLPPARKALLADALHRLEHQALVLEQWGFLAGRPGARGVRLLLSGPPGTGKTLAAEVLAQALGVDLLVVDIARLVSKWIGETEKHLAGVFDAAERSRAVLLFDEADALFGRRTEVADAHDRYANLETAYLLSRLERFEGLALLSTNLKQNIDPAFLRRLEFVIDFEPPAAAEREALWRCHLPPQAPLGDDVSVRELATLYPVNGGLIRNAAVAAAFRAAAQGEPISRRHLVAAVAIEYEKSGKSFPGLPAGMSSL